MRSVFSFLTAMASWASVLVASCLCANGPYPVVEPYNRGHLQVSALHRIYFEEYGNPDGLPVVVVHGGPCWGCPPAFSRFFDPAFYRVILFDQRGCGRSEPLGEMRENTTQALIGDMEALRKQLSVERWWLFGGSWGSTLSIAYGQAHPQSCLGFVLRGVFLADEQATNNVVYGMQRVFPEAYAEWEASFPQEERSDLIEASFTRVMDPDPDVHMPVARAFMKYDTRCATLLPKPDLLEAQLRNETSNLLVTRGFFHFAKHKFFLAKGELLGRLDRIQQLPCTIVHGRYDSICPALGAYTLHQAWPGSQLVFVEDAGHSSGEKGIEAALLEAMELIKSSAGA